MTDTATSPSAEPTREAADADAIANQISLDVGARLRALREQRQLSLNQVEELSEGAFGMSTIGAYERGERVVSLPRLRRLADLYGVPLDHVLPVTMNNGFGRRTSPITEPLRIDVARLYQLGGESFFAMIRYVDSIRRRRGDTDAPICTLRGADALVISAILDVPVEQVVGRLRALDLSPAALIDSSGSAQRSGRHEIGHT